MVRPAPRLPVLAAALAAGLGLAGAPDPVSAGGAEPAGPAAEGPDMPEDAAAVTLTVPVDRDRRALPLIVLELGTLPSGAAVTVARADGTVLGGYAPFGPDRGPSTTRIPPARRLAGRPADAAGLGRGGRRHPPCPVRPGTAVAAA